MSKTKSIEYDGFDIEVTRGADGRVVVRIENTRLEDEGDIDDSDENGVPMCRVWINEALIYSNGEVGDDLPLPADYPDPAPEEIVKESTDPGVMGA